MTLARTSPAWLALGVFVLSCGLSLAQEKAGKSASSTSPGRIAELIKQLDADRFRVREAATEQLTKAGRAAVAPLAKAAAKGGLEVTVRAVEVLTRLAMSEEPLTAQAAREALEELADPRLTAASDRAAAALVTLDALEAQRAIGKVLKLGAEYGSGSNLRGGGTVETHLVLRKKKWDGGTEGLKLFRWLSDVKYVSIHGCKLTDDAVPHLKRLNHLQKLELYGTRITDDGVEKLRAALPGAEIDVRRGGLLGVSGRFGLPNCQFTDVRPGSAAAKAGLQIGDVVLRCDDKPIDNFQKLLQHISTKEGGDKLKLKILRGGREIDAEVTLGEWGDS